MEYYIATTKQLCEDLEQLHYNENDVYKRSGKAAKSIQKTLKSFRDKIRKVGFDSTEDEIHFFKYVKPKIQAYLIFYSVLLEIENAKLHMSDDEIKNFIDKKMRMFRHIMREHIDFVKYYTNGMEHLDKLYFIRNENMTVISRHSSTMLVDSEFNTSHDQIAADIIAFELFKKHVIPRKEIHPTFNMPKPKLKWTESKADFVEFVYAIHAVQSLNHGDVDIMELCSELGLLFQIKVDDPYRTFIDIANRKKEVLKFIPKLESAIVKRIEEQNKI